MDTARLTTSAIAVALILFGCAEPESSRTSDDEAPNVVDIVATGLTFSGPSSIASGWTTIRLKNESGMVHFALLQRLPEGIGLEDQQQQVAPVFQEGMNLLNAGSVEAALEKFGELPEWFGQIVFVGGPGLIAGGETAQSTVNLTPGTYLLECYVKTNGIFHSYPTAATSVGMVHELTVTEDSTAASEPSATLAITLSSERGIEVEGAPTPGRHTVAVHFEDQITHENFVGHDIHLARIDADSDIDELADWMDWSKPSGLETPAPVKFLGGINEMAAGETGYFTVDLEPGSYAWVAEVPGTIEKGLLKTFSVAPSAASDG